MLHPAARLAAHPPIQRLVCTIALALVPLLLIVPRAEGFTSFRGRSNQYHSGSVIGLAVGRSGSVWTLASRAGGGATCTGFRSDGTFLGTFDITDVPVIDVTCFKDSMPMVLGAPVACVSTARVYDPGGAILRTVTVVADEAKGGCPVACATGPDTALYVLMDNADVVAFDPTTGARGITRSLDDGSAQLTLGKTICSAVDGTLYVGLELRYADDSRAYRLRGLDYDSGAFGDPIAVQHPITRTGTDLSGDLYVLSTDPQWPQDVLSVYDPHSPAPSTPIHSQVLAAPHVLSGLGVIGDHRCGVHIAADSTGYHFTRVLTADADDDGLCDTWEYSGLRLRRSDSQWRFSGSQASARWRHKDLYVEIDAMQKMAPSVGAMEDVLAALNEAPSSAFPVPNDDGQPGIALHYALSDTTIVDQTLYENTMWNVLDSLKQQYIADADERESLKLDDCLRLRSHVYRYALFVDTLLKNDGRRPAGRAKNTTGCRDLIVALGPAMLAENVPVKGGTRNQQASGFMHELGHAIGLKHGGGDDNAYKPNYRSVMSYIWNIPTTFTEPFWRLTYSQRAYNRLDKAATDEIAGIGGEPALTALVYAPKGDSLHKPVPEYGRADLNNNGSWGIEPCPLLDAQGTGWNDAPDPRFLEPYADWPLVRLSPASNNVSSGGSGTDELTWEQVEMLFTRNGGQACDCNRNARPDRVDIADGRSSDGNSNGIPDECERPRVAVSALQVMGCPRGDGDNMEIAIDLEGLCAYDQLETRSPVFAVAHLEAGSTLRLWNGDTLVSYVSGTPNQFWIYPQGWSGYGQVWFDVYAGTLHVGETPVVTVRSLDSDPLVLGAVDRFDRADVRAHLGETLDRLDFDGDGVVTAQDSLLVESHHGDGLHSHLLCPTPADVWTTGDSALVCWVRGYGDSAKVDLIVCSTFGDTMRVGHGREDNGTARILVPAGVDEWTSPTVEVHRTAGVDPGDESAVYDLVRDGKPITVQDGMRPAAVANLSRAMGRHTATLTWTEAGDDSLTGVPELVEVRYSTAPITNANFSNAEMVSDPGAPGEGGSIHCSEIGYLTPCTNYYFALKTRDEAGHWSPMSNVASGTTKCTGTMEVTCGEGGMLAEGYGENGWELENLVLDAAHVVPEGSDLYRMKTPLEPASDGSQVRLVNRAGAALSLDLASLIVADHAEELSAWCSGDKLVTGVAHRVCRVATAAEEIVTSMFEDPVNSPAFTRGDTLEVRFTEGGELADGLLLETIGRSRSTERDSSGVLIQIPSSRGGWTTVAHHHPRQYFDECLIDSLSSARARLVFLSDVSLRRINWVEREGAVSVRRLSLMRATHSRTAAVTTAVATADRTSTTLEGGDVLSLSFEVPGLEKGMVRDWFLEVRAGSSAARDALMSSLAPQDASVVPMRFSLLQNRPNPFSGTTTLRFDVPHQSHVKIAVFDLQGRRVRVLTDRVYGPGTHSVDWNETSEGGATVRPGIYLYEMVTPAFCAQRKMVIVH